MAPISIQFDLEVSNRCNAKCSFCPRDYTPHQGLMTPETFDRALSRVIEFRDAMRARGGVAVDAKVSLCGLGEPLLNPHTPAFVKQVRDAGLFCTVSSNGALLTEKKGQALLEAGLSSIAFNVAETGDEYEEVYQLDWEKTRDRIVAFRAMAGDACSVSIVLVEHRGGSEHTRELRAFWERQGIDDFFVLDVGNLSNRGGTLSFDTMRFDDPADREGALRLLDGMQGPVLCGLPFLSLFVGYDGQYYLCCSDWTKETPLGSVHDRSFIDVMGAKLEHVVSRMPVCARCSYDPFNKLTSVLGQVRRGEVPAHFRRTKVRFVARGDASAREVLARLGIAIPEDPGPSVYDVEAPRVHLPIASSGG